MAKKKRSSGAGGPAGRVAAQSAQKQTVRKHGIANAILMCGVVVLVVTNALTYAVMKEELRKARQNTGAIPAGGESAKLGDFKVCNAHEHLYMESHLGKYLEAARKAGIARTLFVASPEFTLMGGDKDKVKGMDTNTELLLDMAAKYPGKIIPFCGVPLDAPNKVDMMKEYISRGAKGLKLYSGHGSFYDRQLDCDEMLPVYAFCEETGFPICWHVNLLKYLNEFKRVMRRFPNLNVIVPHFGVAFWRPTEQAFAELGIMLEKYPNMYTDTSFGTRQIMVGGLEEVNRHPEIFLDFFDKYCDRILFGSDMVVTGNREKTPEWIEAVLRACRDVLEKESYHFFMGARGSKYAYNKKNVYGNYRGLGLDEKTLRKIYETNVDKVLGKFKGV